MIRSVSKTIVKVLAGIIGIILIAQSLVALDLSFLCACDYPKYFQIKTFALYLVGEIIIGLLCYIAPEKNPTGDFFYVSHQCAALGAAYIIISVIVKGFPDYSNLYNMTAVAVILICLFIFASFIKLYRLNSFPKNRSYLYR